MKLIQCTIFTSIAYFVLRLLLDKSEESKTCSFMAIMVLSIVILLLHHVNSINKQLKNEIDKKNNNSINPNTNGGDRSANKK